MKIRLISFGFKNGAIPSGETFVFDCRALANPHHQQALRPLTGLDYAVKAFVARSEGFDDLYAKAKFHALGYADPTIAFGCFGGRHRSVALAELLAEDLRAMKHQVQVTHRELVSA